MTRNESSVIAFQIPESAFSSYQIIASHSDCPTFKVKGEDPFVTDGHYTRLNVEGYGGMIRSPWFDRPLSLAGRMVVRDGNSVKSVLVDAGRDLVTIPNLPIHLNRDINNGIKYSVQTDMLPILGDETAKDHFYELFLPDTAKRTSSRWNFICTTAWRALSGAPAKNFCPAAASTICRAHSVP